MRILVLTYLFIKLFNPTKQISLFLNYNKYPTYSSQLLPSFYRPLLLYGYCQGNYNTAYNNPLF
jgi:hypothetical protein